jgi:uncharacterized damage-inducible protein DinB
MYCRLDRANLFLFQFLNHFKMNETIETFRIQQRIHLYLLDAIDQEHLSDQSASKGRTVAEQFAHIHKVRRMWLKAPAPELLQGLEKLGKKIH